MLVDSKEKLFAHALVLDETWVTWPLGLHQKTAEDTWSSVKLCKKQAETWAAMVKKKFN